ncbi:MAG: hypothetical protein O7G84_09530, partial [Gammaproteobacteria bacterium]|nr:hypothetical protein [Gammaproteobacteria bacterium]
MLQELLQELAPVETTESAYDSANRGLRKLPFSLLFQQLSFRKSGKCLRQLHGCPGIHAPVIVPNETT